MPEPSLNVLSPLMPQENYQGLIPQETFDRNGEEFARSRRRMEFRRGWPRLRQVGQAGGFVEELVLLKPGPRVLGPTDHSWVANGPRPLDRSSSVMRRWNSLFLKSTSSIMPP